MLVKMKLYAYNNFATTEKNLVRLFNHLSNAYTNSNPILILN